jgi:hypothetical protein
MYLVYILLIVSSSAYALGERTVSLGGESTWRLAEYRNDITEVASVRPQSVLVISQAGGSSTAGYRAATGTLGNFYPLTEASLDMSISFDERQTGLYRDSLGHYRISAAAGVEAADRRYARAGNGSALFSNNGAVIIHPQNRNALFAPGSRFADFTMEFWLYPVNMENGEQILSWISSGGSSVQRNHSAVSRNRLHGSFVNFFASTNGASFLNIEFSGNVPVVPKAWSHHLIRFDAVTGMIEYLVNGVSEAVVYATRNGREGGEVYTPYITGTSGSFLLGERFTGLIDEFKIHRVCADRSSVYRYIPSGGRIETGAVDLGDVNSVLVRVDASGGRVGAHNSEFRENGRFRFSDDSEMNFFIRANENPYLLSGSPWVNFVPGSPVSGVEGRYVQIAVDFYPSADGETSPYLEQLRIVYLPGEPPMPPRNLTAVAVDGGVLLRWRSSPDAKTDG